MMFLGGLAITLLLQVGVPTPKVALEGAVVRADSGAAIPGAQVTVIKEGSEVALVSLTGDAQGHFIIPNVDPGTYHVFAARNGFARAEYGQRTANGRGTAITIVEGQKPKDLTLRLLPAGTITGRILDAGGEPVTGFGVELLRAVYDSTGTRLLLPSLSAKTDDRGEYRLFWVTPGKYYLSVNPQSPFEREMKAITQEMPRVMNQPGGVASGSRSFLELAAALANSNQVRSIEGYSLTYYPGTTDRSRAQLLEVRAGSELGGINFQLVRQPAVRIRGRVFDSTGQPGGKGEASLFSSDGLRVQASVGTDSTFEMSQVPPGSYRLGVDVKGGYATARIDVTGSDIENLVLTAKRGVTVTGQVRVDNPAASNSASLDQITVLLSTTDSEAGFDNSGRITANGTFTIDVFPGRYWVKLQDNPPNVYLKEIHAGATDLLRDVLVVSDTAPQNMELVIGNRPGRIEGSVTDQTRRPVSGVEVTLIPNQPRARFELYRTAFTDSDGHYVIDQVTPGDYRVFAWEDIEPFSFYDADVLKPHEQAGTAVRVPEGMSSSQDIKLIPAPAQ